VPEFRRKGVFRLLYEHLHGLAQLEPDVVGIRLYVENENCRAQETYRNMGLNPAGYSVMEKFFGLPAVGSDRPAG
jgi:ribosomal protein S18 acetylase RimI-like enzyme